MAKLVYVPDWLHASLELAGQPITKLSDSDIFSSIVSKADVINYFKAQYEFLKMLTLPIAGGSITTATMSDLFYHVSTLPEVELYYRTAAKDNVDFSMLVSKPTSGAQEIDFRVEGDPSSNVVYIIGNYDTNPKWVKERTRSVTNALTSDILEAAHAHIRVENMYTDKSTALRNNPVIAQFYVKSIVN